MLLRNILYSMQRSKTSEDDGEWENPSSDFEILNDPQASFSRIAIYSFFPEENSYNWGLFESWLCLHFLMSSESMTIILANKEEFKQYKPSSPHLLASPRAGCFEVGKCQHCQQGQQPFLSFCSDILGSWGCFLHGYKLVLQAWSITSPVRNIQNEEQGGGQMRSFSLYHPLFYEGKKIFPEVFLYHWLELP